MTKRIAVISCFFIFFFLLDTPVLAGYILRETGTGRSKSFLLIPDSGSSTNPAISFETILGISIQQIPQPTSSAALNSRLSNIQHILTQLDSIHQPNKNTYSLPSKKITSFPHHIGKPTPALISNFSPDAFPSLITAISDKFSTPSDPTTYNSSRLSGIHDAADAHSSQAASGQPTTFSPSPDISPLPAIGNLITNPKNTYIVAILGDSMVDTMGRDLRVLKDFLKDSYPAYSFAVLNYGFGSTDMDSGLFRLTHHTTYLDKPYAALLSYRPDILVVESFAYNHWSGNQYDLDRHWLTIAKIIDTVKVYSPTTHIVLFSTIAPNPLTFGDGALKWNPAMKWESAQTTKAYLENMTRFATSEHYPLADAYHPTLDASGYGKKIYINAGDNIHLSDEGRRFVSSKIAEAIKENKLIQ